MDISIRFKNTLKKIEENFKMQILVCIILSTVLIIIFFILNNVVDKKNSHKYTISENINLINKIENISIEGDNIFLDGYAFLKGIDSKGSSISLFLLNSNNSDEVWSDIKQFERKDVDSYFTSENIYKHSGFRAYINNDLKDDECYEIILNIDYKDIDLHTKRQTVSSKKYILNERLYDYNPYNFDKPELNIHSELLSKVFSEGSLCLYQKDAGVYIYQYSGRLYWIATEDFIFDENGQTNITYTLYTTQDYKLPNQKYIFDNKGFYFEQYEYKDEVTKPFRIAIREIPENYAITYIKTGQRKNDSWYWSELFQLNNVIN